MAKIWAAVSGLLFFLFSLAFNYGANIYAQEKAGPAVGDLVLDILPYWNLERLLLIGALFLVVLVAGLLVKEPRRIPLVLNGAGLFILVRAIFVVMTHLGPPDGSALVLGNPWLRSIGLAQPADFFFSGHTGFPIFLALMFWPNKKLRAVFLATAVIMAASVLLSRFHYSIDVFAAAFIAYGTFKLGQKVGLLEDTVA